MIYVAVDSLSFKAKKSHWVPGYTGYESKHFFENIYIHTFLKCINVSALFSHISVINVTPVIRIPEIWEKCKIYYTCPVQNTVDNWYFCQYQISIVRLYIAYILIKNIKNKIFEIFYGKMSIFL